MIHRNYQGIVVESDETTVPPCRHGDAPRTTEALADPKMMSLQHLLKHGREATQRPFCAQFLGRCSYHMYIFVMYTYIYIYYIIYIL